MDRGKRLASYKMMKERGQRAVRTQMSGIGIADVESFLKANEAELVKTAAWRFGAQAGARWGFPPWCAAGGPQNDLRRTERADQERGGEDASRQPAGTRIAAKSACAG